MKTKRYISSAILVSLVLTMPFIAEAAEASASRTGKGAPDAGVLLNELEPGRHLTPNPAQPKISVTVPKAQEGSQDLKSRIDKVVFECPDMEISGLLQNVVDKNIHKEMTFSDMQGLALAATEELRAQGYMMAIVYVPVQEISNNTLYLKAAIGRYGDIAITNTSKMVDSRALGFTYGLRPGQLINEKPLDKSLLILNEIPGMQVKASMEPGKKAGTAKLLLDFQNLEREGGYIYVDNYGSKATGRFRYGGNYHINNLSRVGDQIDLSYLASTKSMRNYQLRYSIPVANDGAIARIAYSHMNYNLGDKYSFLNAYGIANTWEFGITVPMKRTLTHSSFYDIAYRHRELRDDMYEGAVNGNKSSDTLDFEIRGYMRGKKDSMSYSVSHLFGNLALNNDYTRALDTYLQSAGHYSKSGASIYYLRQFNDRWQAHLSVSGQYAWNNLDSSEDFYIGGADGVRAFPQGETGGDSGILGTLEFRYRTNIPGLQATAFIDAGRVFYNHDNTYISGDNVRNLAGIGMGLIYTKSRDWYAKFDWATPLGDHYSTSDGNTLHNMFWFRIVKQL